MPYLSELGYIGFARQTASGTHVQPSDFMRVKSYNIMPEQELLVPDAEIGGDRDIPDAIQEGTLKYSGNADFYLRPNALGHLIRGVTGATTSSGITGAAYGHTFTFEDNVEPYSLEARIGEGLEYISVTGAKFSKLHLELGQGELAQGNVEFIGIDGGAGATPRTESYESTPIMSFAAGTVIIDGGEYKVRSVSTDINNNLNEDDYRVGQRTLGTIKERRRDMTVSVELTPEDSTIFRKTYYGSASATTASGAQTVFQGPLFIRMQTPQLIPGTTVPYQLDINFTKVAFRAAPFTTSGEELITQTLEVVPVKPEGGSIGTIVLRNTKASY